MGCSLSGSPIHGIFQARVLEWIASSFSRGSSQPRNRTQVSHIAGRRFTVWATREASSLSQVTLYATDNGMFNFQVIYESGIWVLSPPLIKAITYTKEINWSNITFILYATLAVPKCLWSYKNLQIDFQSWQFSSVKYMSCTETNNMDIDYK